MKKDRFYFIFVRYLMLLVLMFSINIIYFVFTPLTVYSSFKILDVFFKNIWVSENIIIIGFDKIQIINPCVAGSAYLLLLILNLSVPMNLKKRFYSILLSFSLLFILNVLRIVLLAILYSLDSSFFDLTHKLFWYVLSSLFVIGIWFFIVKVFKIKEVPVYSDVKYFLKRIKSKKHISSGNELLKV